MIVEKIPLLVLAAISTVITYCAQQLGGAMGMLGEVPLGTRLGNAVFSYGQYLEKSFWPSHLAAIYPYVTRKPIDLVIVGIALVAISVAAIRLARIWPFLVVGWCWYLVTLLPVIGLVQVGVQSMADRYTYIPLIGIFIIAAWARRSSPKIGLHATRRLWRQRRWPSAGGLPGGRRPPGPAARSSTAMRWRPSETILSP